MSAVEVPDDGGLLPLPQVNFWHSELPNRVDANDPGATEMGHYRVGIIIDEYGHETYVSYGQPPGDTCAATKAGPWESNTQACFPQKFQGDTAVFHKYLALEVTELDPAGGAPASTTTYTYEGEPAWAWDNDDFVSPTDQSWSSWRGYGVTTIAQGLSETKMQVYRGMHGDKLPSGVRSVPIAPLGGTGFSVPSGEVWRDDPWLAGAVLVEATLGPLNVVEEATMHQYANVSFGIPGADPLDTPTWVGESVTTTNVAKTVSTWETRRTTTTYNSKLQPETVYEEGWLSASGDERCTRTNYATSDDTKRMFTYPVELIGFEGTCTSGVEVSHSQTYYDGSTTLGVLPGAGNPTEQRVKVDGTRWATTSQMTYEPDGQVRDVTDANGLVTETRDEPTINGGYPRYTVETVRAGTAPEKTLVTRTDWLVGRGVPASVTDPNGNLTTYTYDDLGRVTRVRQPTEQPDETGKPASWEFTYQISPTKTALPVVRSRQTLELDPDRFSDAWIVYDTALRARQTHTLSPDAGKVIVTDTSYDERGLVAETTAPQAVTGTAGQGLLTATWENRTTTVYDELGRTLSTSVLSGSTEAKTDYQYTHDTATTIDPEGRQRRTTLDGLGRTVSVDERDDDVSPAVWRHTGYDYDAADHLTKVTDPAGNEITYDYNLAGWQTSATDPDSGDRSYEYNDAGNPTRVIDAEGASVYTVYDTLGRPTARHTGNPAAPFATWDYDASTTEKGLLDKSTRHTPAGDWVTDITGYDTRGRPTGKKVIVPAGVPGLSQPTTATEYPVTYGYGRGDNMTTVGYPAVGGLAAETLTTTYNTAGQAESLTSGLGTYVSNATYDDRGSPDVVGLGPTNTMGTRYDYDADGWVSHVETYQGATEIADHTFTYDTIGNLTERTTVLGADEWRECFELDSRYRLDTAYTVDAAATCASGTPGTGDRPYEHDYTYSIDGNLTERVEDATTNTYTYPAPGQARAHAPTQVGADTYQWDANGNLETRTVDGTTENLSWDPEQHLASINAPSGTTSYIYDADGGRLLRETPAGRTLYIDGHEITADAPGTTVTATRSYGFGGQTVATRTPAGVAFLVADQQGSVEASVAGGAIDVARTYDPYGDRRTGGELDTDQGWIGQIEDDTTDLAYLNARYYDPNIGTFISADPVYDPGRPQSLNPYNYAMSNPTSLSDPSGLDPPWTRPGIKKPPLYFQLSYGNTNTGKAIQTAAKAQARATGQSLESATRHAYNNWQAGYSARVAKQRAKKALGALANANSDPGFWRALAAAGSGEALTLLGMRITNPDPGFWRAVANVGAAGFNAIGKHITKLNTAAKDNTTYGGGGALPVFLGGPRDGRLYRTADWGPIGWAAEKIDEIFNGEEEDDTIECSGNCPPGAENGFPRSAPTGRNDGSPVCSVANVLGVPTNAPGAGLAVSELILGHFWKLFSQASTWVTAGAGVIQAGCMVNTTPQWPDNPYVSPQGVPGCDMGWC